ncbi:MAG: hypothetical protein PHH11_08325 [Methylomonas sp.]|nr:hypothetical protein [Methylomonas sp.]
MRKLKLRQHKAEIQPRQLIRTQPAFFMHDLLGSHVADRLRRHGVTRKN